MADLNAKLFIDAAREHGSSCDSFEVEITDLQNMLEVSLSLLPVWAKAQFVKSEPVLGVLQDGGVIEAVEPGLVYGLNRVSATLAGSHPCKGCVCDTGDGRSCANDTVCIAWSIFSRAA